MAYTGKALEAALPILRSLPEGTYFDTGGAALTLEFQASGKMVALLRQQLPHAVWAKSKKEDIGWWEYTTEINGLKVKIYADREGPASCRRIVEEIEVEEDVPVTTEKRMVKKTRVRWECPEEVAP